MNNALMRANNPGAMTPFDACNDLDLPGRYSPAATGIGRYEPYRRLHRILRGRYWLAIILALIFGAAAGLGGYKVTRPVYRSEGLIRIKMLINSVKTNTSENGLLPMYDEYVQSQVFLMSSRTAIVHAMHFPEWLETNMGASPEMVDKFVENLSVDHPTRTEAIRVYYTDPDPAVARAAVAAIIAAFEDLYTRNTDFAKQTRFQVLDQRNKQLQEEDDGYRARLEMIIREYGTKDLGELRSAQAAEMNKFDARITDCNLALAMIERNVTPEEAAAELTINQIGIIDQRMAAKLQRLDMAESQYNQQRARLGENNPTVLELEQSLRVLRADVAKYADDFRQLQVKMAKDPRAVVRGGIPLLVQNQGAIKHELEQLQIMREAARKEMVRLGNKQQDIEELQGHLTRNEKELQENKDHIETMKLEGQMGDRLQIISKGEVPATFYKDRRKIYAALAGLGGALLPVMLLVCLGMADRRYRYSEDAENEQTSVPLLGILPTLPSKKMDAAEAAIAAHCIHQIRIMLQMQAEPGKARVVLVTGVAAGDGKTSLSMALGLSFAASGSRTLVIDADMVGQGLTHRLKINGSAGLLEALMTGTLHGRVKKTTTTNLWILPVGTAESSHAGILSRQSVKHLLSESRRVFDVIVVDTGPILGSLEASVLAPEADSVILTLTRGQNQSLVNRALRMLRSLGAKIAGVVFNRAERRDFHRSVASASIRSSSSTPSLPKMLIAETEESSRFGPLARAVASFTPAQAAGAAGGPSVVAAVSATASSPANAAANSAQQSGT